MYDLPASDENVEQGTGPLDQSNGFMSGMFGFRFTSFSPFSSDAGSICRCRIRHVKRQIVDDPPHAHITSEFEICRQDVIFTPAHLNAGQKDFICKSLLAIVGKKHCMIEAWFKTLCLNLTRGLQVGLFAHGVTSAHMYARVLQTAAYKILRGKATTSLFSASDSGVESSKQQFYAYSKSFFNTVRNLNCPKMSFLFLSG